jgi:DNA mismatch repair protein MutS2
MLDEEREIARATTKEAAEEQTRLQKVKETLTEQQRLLKQTAASQASSLIEHANARIERTIREIKESAADKKITRAARIKLEEYRESLDEVANAGESKSRGVHEGGAANEELRPGDRVVVDGGTAPAEVVSVRGGEVEVNTGSMRMRLRRDRLRKVGGREERRVFISRNPTTDSSIDMPLRLDLRGSRVDEAVWKVTQHVDKAVAAGLHRVEILHGKGTGALRKAIRECLDSRVDVGAVNDAELERGGSGITVAELL